ncbi:GAF domain-containing protein, partial [bacterium]
MKWLRHPAIRISLLYLITSTLWIAYSDRLLGIMAKDPNEIIKLSTYKGWGFVILTSILLFSVLMREFTIRQHREREVTAIARLSTATRFSMSRDELLPAILDEIINFTQADTAAVVLYDRNQGDFQVELSKGEHPYTTGTRIPYENISGRVMDSEEPYLNNHADKDPNVYQSERFLGMNALAVAPLVVQQNKLGVLMVAKVGNFDAANFKLLVAVADIAASAIHRLTLFDQTVQRVQQLSTLRSIDLAITSNLDLTSILNILIDEVLQLHGISAASVLMPIHQDGLLHFRAGKGFTTDIIHKAVLSAADYEVSNQFPSRYILTISDLRETSSSPRHNLSLAEDFIVYHAIPLVSKNRINGVLEVYQKDVPPLSHEVMDFLESLATQAAIAIDVATLIEDLQSSNQELTAAYDSTIEGWSRALDLRDKETEGHTQRVTEMALHLARAVGMNEEELVHVYRGSLMHDIGKMGIPDSILLKPAPLTPEEIELMKMHPIYAYHLLKPIRFLHPALDIPYCHHERWDGSGYPRGLKGTQIPLAARIFAVVDVWDALVSDRPYS